MLGLEDVEQLQAVEARTLHPDVEKDEVGPNLVFLDIWMQGSRLDGLQLLDVFQTQHPEMPVVMISGHGNIETAVSMLPCPEIMTTGISGCWVWKTSSSCKPSRREPCIQMSRKTRLGPTSSFSTSGCRVRASTACNCSTSSRPSILKCRSS